MIDDLQQKNYEYLMTQALARAPRSVDIREGSVIFDGVAISMYELAMYYMAAVKLLEQTFAQTAAGEYLDLRVSERGLTRYEPTKAVKRIDVKDQSGQPMSIPIGSRFSTTDIENQLNYTIVRQFIEDGLIVEGSYEAICEDFGTQGNIYTGRLIPVSNINGLGSASMSSLLTPARDLESDDQLRARYVQALQSMSYGGNVNQYNQWLADIPGVGEAQVYPAWQGGGSVLLSVIDSTYDPITNEFADQILEILDPGHDGLGTGIVRVGHNVTVTTPTVFTVDVEVKVRARLGHSPDSVQAALVRALEQLFLDLRKEWGVGDAMNKYETHVYVARLASVMFAVEGVENVTDVTLNGAPLDITLEQTQDLQQLPYLGEVIFND